MASYTAQRLLWFIPVMLGLASVTFLLMHFVPGGPWDQEKRLPPSVTESLNRRYGLSDPLWRQYAAFLARALKGDLGVSYTYRDRRVTEIIRQGLPATLTLGAAAFAASVGVGLPLGVAAAVRKGTVFDYLALSFSTLAAGVPGFVMGALLVALLSVRWHLLPSGGWGTSSHLVMPVLALAALPAAFIARVTRASVLDALGQDYVVTARAKGLSPSVVHYRHVLKNAAIPVLSIMGPQLALLVTGSFIVESVFSIPGIGRLFVQGVLQRDYGLIMGMVLLYGFVIALMNLAVDLLYGVVDPRIRYR